MHLADCFNDIFAFTVSLLELCGENEQPSLLSPAAKRDNPAAPSSLPASVSNIISAKEYAQSAPATSTLDSINLEKVRDTYCRLFAASNELANRYNFSENDYRLAKFAVCAWVDEMISSSRWPQKVKWPKAELQRQHFNTTNAGEEFYQKLCGLRPAQVEVMEVFANCLALGFHGCYYQPNTQEELAGIRLAACRAVLGYSPEQEETRKLFASAYPTGRGGDLGGASGAGGWGQGGRYAAWGRAATGICCVLLPLAVFVVMYLVYSGLLGRLVNGFGGSL